MDNYFRSDPFSIIPCQVGVRVIGNFGQSFKQNPDLILIAREPPEMWGALKGHTDHVMIG